MSQIDELRAALLARPQLVAIAGAAGVFVDIAPDKRPLPYCIVRRVGVDRIMGLDDNLQGRRETFHVESWGETRQQSEDLHDQAEAALVAAGMAPETADPDGLDPNVGARAGVWVVDIWS